MNPLEVSPGVIVETYGGACPFQAEGTIDGFAFYFRSRGEGMSLSIDQYGGEDADPTDVGHGRPGFHIDVDFRRWPGAGYINDEWAFETIARGALVFRWLREARSELAWNPDAWTPAEPLSPVAARLLGMRVRAFAAACNLSVLLKMPRIGRIPADVEEAIKNATKLLEDFHHYETWQRAAWGDPTVAALDATPGAGRGDDDE